LLPIPFILVGLCFGIWAYRSGRTTFWAACAWALTGFAAAYTSEASSIHSFLVGIGAFVSHLIH
jgi:hypothetical protein